MKLADAAYLQYVKRHREETTAATTRLLQLVAEITHDARPKGIPEYDRTEIAETSVSPVRLPGL